MDFEGRVKKNAGRCKKAPSGESGVVQDSKRITAGATRRGLLRLQGVYDGSISPAVHYFTARQFFLFCEKCCTQVAVSVVWKQGNNYLTFVFRAGCKKLCCFKGCTA